jgi:chemotaxis protein CheC
MPKITLSELEQDALTELVNIGVSRAASSLRKMVGEQIFLAVPAVDVVTQQVAARMIDQEGAERLIAVRQLFAGAIAGHALLILPESKGVDWARAVAGDNIPPDTAMGLTEDVLTEAGNIILNGCVGSFANMLQRSLAMSLPEVLRGNGSSLLDIASSDAADEVVLFLYVNFSIRSRDLRGYIAIVMDVPSFQALKGLLGEFIDEALGAGAQVEG